MVSGLYGPQSCYIELRPYEVAVAEYKGFKLSRMMLSMLMHKSGVVHAGVQVSGGRSNQLIGGNLSRWSQAMEYLVVMGVE